jgi:hypothetical protein
MLCVVLHYRETGPIASPPAATACHEPATAWTVAHKLKRAHPQDRVTVLQGAEREVD